MDKRKKEKNIFWQTMAISMQLGYLIALPLVILALIGRTLDKYYNSTPLFIIMGILLSVISSSILVGIKINKIIKSIDANSKNKKN